MDNSTDRSPRSIVWRRLYVAGAGCSLLWAIIANQAYSQSVIPTGPEFQVNVDTTQDQGEPDVSVAADGSFVVVWQSLADASAQYEVRARRFDSQGNPGGEMQVNSYTTFQQLGASVSATEDGFLVLWFGEGASTTTGNDISSRRLDSLGQPTATEGRVDVLANGFESIPRLSGSVSGSHVAVWQSDVAEAVPGFGITGTFVDTTGLPIGADFPINGTTSGDQLRPSISRAAGGSFVVVWEGPDGDNKGIYGRRFDSAGQPIGMDLLINDITTGLQDEPDLIHAADGSFLVVWRGPGAGGIGGGSNIRGRLFDSAGAPVAASFVINTHTTNSQGQPAVSSDGDEYVVVWESFGQDGSLSSIEGQRLSTSGAALGGQFQVNTHTPLDQYAPRIDHGGDGFVVTWESYSSSGDDSSDRSIQARRFCGDVDDDSVCNAVDQCSGFDDAVDVDGDLVPAGCDCDDDDGAASALDVCGVCGGDGMTCSIFADGFESGTVALWSSAFGA